jgi:GntR family transcriptional regulator
MRILYYYNNTVALGSENRGNMLLQIDHHSGVPIYRQVIEQVRRQIMAGQLPAGQQLMSVRDLAGQLKVNPMTISKAYTMLEMEGLLERRRGVGLFIARVRKDQKSQTKTQLLEQVLSRAVATAIQLDIPEEEVHGLTQRLFEKHSAKLRSEENE